MAGAHVTASSYDRIGRGYAGRRRPDPRIGGFIVHGLGDARSVVNVGAGAGSYEPRDRRIVAVEPSDVMLAQRPTDSAPSVRARAEALPFARASFDAAMAVLTVQHWTDWRAGLAELRRVARRVVLLTWDPESDGLWLTEDYLPKLLANDRRKFPLMAELRDALGAIAVVPVPIPHDCNDGFMGAYWRRPEAYLDPDVRRSISTFAEGDARAGLDRLAADLASGGWVRRYEALRDLPELDLGYRLVVAGSAR